MEGSRLSIHVPGKEEGTMKLRIAICTLALSILSLASAYAMILRDCTIKSLNVAEQRVVVIQRDMGTAWSFPVVQTQQLAGLHEGDQVTIELDADGRAVKIEKQ
jgi:hypothetical protein